MLRLLGGFNRGFPTGPFTSTLGATSTVIPKTPSLSSTSHLKTLEITSSFTKKFLQTTTTSASVVRPIDITTPILPSHRICSIFSTFLLRRNSNSSGNNNSSNKPQLQPQPSSSSSSSSSLTSSSSNDIDLVSALEQVPGLGQLLDAPALVVTREYEWGNILLGFEQANKYTIRAAPYGNIVGYIAEESQSISKAITRNVLRTHRPFKATVLDLQGNPVLVIRRPFYVVSTSLYVESPYDDGKTRFGEVHMNWHPWRRKYDLYTGKKQFAKIDSPLLSWDFDMADEQGNIISSVNRDFTGLARELFTDTGQYVLRMVPGYGLEPQAHMHMMNSSAPSQPYPALGTGQIVTNQVPMSPLTPSPIPSHPTQAPEPSKRLNYEYQNLYGKSTTSNTTPPTAPGPNMLVNNDATTAAVNNNIIQQQMLPYTQLNDQQGLSLIQRAVMLGCAISIDFDYFSRHSHGGGGWFPFFMPLPIPSGGTTTSSDASQDGTATAAGVAGGMAEGSAGTGSAPSTSPPSVNDTSSTFGVDPSATGFQEKDYDFSHPSGFDNQDQFQNNSIQNDLFSSDAGGAEKSSLLGTLWDMFKED